jgi:hypothetical protein
MGSSVLAEKWLVFPVSVTISPWQNDHLKRATTVSVAKHPFVAAYAAGLVPLPRSF